MTTSTLPKSRQQLILAVLMVCSLLIWLDNTVLSTTLETLADPVRGLNAGPAELRLVAVPALIVAALTMGAYGLFGLGTPLVWIEVVLLVQGLSIRMVLGPVTAALISTLPLERAGAGSAVRQTGSVIGIAVGGPIMSIVYRRAIEPAWDGGPTADETAPGAGAEDLTAREGDDVGTR
ncbi:hypothetical protein ACQP1V_31940 [Microtetraspora malaysiensis]|uniref:hypothetical protein n=1 Tax=Microtetraspora malaysiensis TaxID=161358 RepID=UPI003D935DF7